MLEPKIEIVQKGFWAAFLAFFGFAGFTLYTGKIIIRHGLTPERLEQVIKHEQVHISQIQKEGIFLFTVGYLKEHFKNGYRNNKYELEARIKAGEI